MIICHPIFFCSVEEFLQVQNFIYRYIKKRCKYMRLVKGHGIYEKGKYKCSINRKPTREYNLWSNMLGRVYSASYHIKKPTYKNVSVCERWIYFQNFAEDINNMYGFNLKDDKGNNYQLDKDFLNIENKIYSKENCVFIPSELNNFITQLQVNKGKFPTGVTYNKRYKKYQAILYGEGKREFEFFDSVEECRTAYIKSRNNYARKLAHRYSGKVDQRVIGLLETYNEEDYTGNRQEIALKG